jgi:hypothetical protein
VSRVDVVYAANMQAGDLFAGLVVPDAPTTPVQEFAAAHQLAGVEPFTGEDGRKWMRLTAGPFALTPVLASAQCLVIRL